jgi:hypothetical protein
MEKDIGKIPKNSTTDIVIRMDDFGGKTGLTIREFVTSEKYTGFTKAGTRIPAEHFLTFREMINSISLHDLSKKEDESDQQTIDGEEEVKTEKPGKSQNEEFLDY